MRAAGRAGQARARCQWVRMSECQAQGDPGETRGHGGVSAEAQGHEGGVGVTRAALLMTQAQVGAGRSVPLSEEERMRVVRDESCRGTRGG